MPKAKLQAPGLAKVREHYIEEKMPDPVHNFFRERQNYGGNDIPVDKIIKI
jgi:hypothetical protein